MHATLKYVATFTESFMKRFMELYKYHCEIILLYFD